MRFDLKPYHVLRAVAAVCVVVALFTLPGISWFLLAALCLVGEWYTRVNHIGWPADVEEPLARRGLSAQRSQSSSAAPAADTESPIPFRAMTITELYSSAFKVVLRNWPALLGIPVVILGGFVLVFTAVLTIGMKIAFNASTSVNGGLYESTAVSSDPMGTLTAMMLVFILLSCAVAFPADALLIALSVIATDKAVRGLPVRVGEVFRLARSRIFAVCRLTLAFYLLFCIPEMLITGFGSMVFGIGGGFLLAVLLCTAFSFVVGILLSLAPIVLVVEGRGVMDTFRRTIEMSKPAWGRLIGIHVLWLLCSAPLMVLSFLIGFNPLLFGLILAGMIALFRTLQVLIYTDLRMRQENYDQELLADWTKNVGPQGLSSA
ncbi:hypothetical protein DVS77_18540 [Mycolicibacterium moriokaense]|nr:hypothetical protein DVS77_18540 [Mycolicibacterium moriokaense]